MQVCSILTYQREKFSKNDFSETLADIKLRLSYPGNNGIVLVEGDSDLVIMKHHFASKIYLITPYCKKSAINIIEQIGVKYKNIIAILDLDYSARHNDERVFYYDGCNLEMMLVKNNDIFDNFCSKGQYSKNDLILFRDTCLEKAKPFSCLRFLISDGGNKGLFPMVGVKTICPQLNCCLTKNSDEFINYIKNEILFASYEPELELGDKQAIHAYYSSNILVAINFDTYEITNGHDFNELFIKFIYPKIKCSLKVSKNNSIYKLYENSFSNYIFNKTNLYQNIRQYEIKYGLNFLL